MILKIVMSPIESHNDFVKQCRMRLPDLQSSEFQKILDMKVMSMLKITLRIELRIDLKLHF